MKTMFIKNLIKDNSLLNQEIEIKGWITSIRRLKKQSFLTLVDSTGQIQVLISTLELNRLNLVPEQSLSICGILNHNSEKNQIELHSFKIAILGNVERTLAPHPRQRFDIFDSKYAKTIAENRHLYIRNPKLMAALKARHDVLGAVHSWFRQKGYIEITAPILTPILLYDVDTGIKAQVGKEENIFLTQCVGFYLESAVHAFEKVYNIGPSFRGKEANTKRHLTEYWHVKAELAFCNFEEFFVEVEDMINFIVTECQKTSEDICNVLGKEFCADGLKGPFPRITYTDAVKLLNDHNINVEYGKSINDAGEEVLSNYFHSPVWITHNHRNVEGFPYKIVEENNDLTYTADLICSEVTANC